MKFLDSLFKSEKTYRGSVQTRSQTNTNGVLGPVVWTTTKTVDCIFWRGGLSDVTVSQKIKADIVGTILMRPSDISAQEIPTNSRILLSESARYCKVNNSGGYPVGTLTISVDDTLDNNYPIKKGDTFLIAGEATAPVHTVTTVSGSPTTSITFTTAIAAGGVANDAIITITPVMGYFSVIYPDNIGGQDEVIMIPVKDFA